MTAPPPPCDHGHTSHDRRTAVTADLATRGDAEPSLAALRDGFRARNGIVETDRRVEWIRLGPVPFPVPNSPARRRAVRIHDLHHLVAGYGTDLTGEFQASAWECGAGLHDEPVAWVACPVGTLGGMVRCPRRTVAAYARGRRSRTLYGQRPERADALTLAAATAWCRTGVAHPRPTPRDWVGATGWAAVGVVSLLMPPLAAAFGRRRPPPPSACGPTGDDGAAGGQPGYS